jgi:hypothetical protein
MEKHMYLIEKYNVRGSNVLLFVSLWELRYRSKGTYLWWFLCATNIPFAANSSNKCLKEWLFVL